MTHLEALYILLFIHFLFPGRHPLEILFPLNNMSNLSQLFRQVIGSHYSVNPYVLGVSTSCQTRVSVKQDVPNLAHFLEMTTINWLPWRPFTPYSRKQTIKGTTSRP